MLTSNIPIVFNDYIQKQVPLKENLTTRPGGGYWCLEENKENKLLRLVSLNTFWAFVQYWSLNTHYLIILW